MKALTRKTLLALLLALLLVVVLPRHGVFGWDFSTPSRWRSALRTSGNCGSLLLRIPAKHAMTWQHDDEQQCSSSASSVLRVSAFMAGAPPASRGPCPPDAAIAWPQHQCASSGKYRNFASTPIRFAASKRLISFRKIDAIIELRMHNQHRRLQLLTKFSGDHFS